MLVRQAKRYISGILISLLLLTTFAVPVFAASSTFLSEATKYFNSECKSRAKGDEAAICYLFEKSKELESMIANIHTINVGQDAQITELQNKLSELETALSVTPTPSPTPTEAPTPTPTPTGTQSTTISFALNRPQPFDSDWQEVSGYNSIKINLSITGFITQYDVQYSDDPGSGYTVQTTVNCNSQTTCPEVTLPIIGDYYRISTGTASGNVTSTALLTP